MQATLERLRQRQEDEGEGGFTLIELLIVIVILGVLAAIVVFAVQNLTGSSAQTACRADSKTVESATEAYKAQEGAYPASTAVLLTAAADGNGPWLKDNPVNGTHYAIATSGGTVKVDSTTGTPPADSGTAIANGCSGVS